MGGVCGTPHSPRHPALVSPVYLCDGLQKEGPILIFREVGTELFPVILAPAVTRSPQGAQAISPMTHNNNTIAHHELTHLDGTNNEPVAS